MTETPVSMNQTTFTLNGQSVSASGSPTTRLSETLRVEFHREDVKVGCNAGDCGACTVLVAGEPVCACLTATSQVAGKSVSTLDGLLKDPGSTAQRLADAFLRHGAAQCGICTPGMMVAATDLLSRQANPDEQQVQDALGGVLCRCTGYRKIIDAVLDCRSDAPASVPADLPGRGQSGESAVRIDGRLKVSGSERFGDDGVPSDAWHLRLVRSPFHHASFDFGDLQAWCAQQPGIERVFTASDIPGTNRHGVIPNFIDQPVFAIAHARFKGEAVAAVVGTDAAIAEFDVQRFPVTFTERPAHLDAASAQDADATQLHDDKAGNVMCEGRVQRGDVEAALQASAHVVEGRFTTGFVEHAYIEPEAGYARRVGDRIEIHGCTQAPYMDRDSLAGILGLDVDAVRIVPSAVGGGFGSKLDLSFQPYVALAAWHMRASVRIVYSRIESMQSTTKRHPADMSVRIGVDANGSLTAVDFSGQFNTGAYASWGPTVANRVPVHASGPYYTPNYRACARGVHTHCAPAGAFRGFGVPQAAIAQESLFDELSDRVGMDRLAFRRHNALGNNMPTVTGQTFADSVGIDACLEALSEPWDKALLSVDAFNREAEQTGSPRRRGIGVASGWYGCGNTSLPNPSTIRAGIRRDGTLCLHQGAVDIGQGSNTVVAQIFATALGVPLSDISLESADTDITPDAGKTSASRQTFVSGNAARLAGATLREAILRLSNASDGADIELGHAEIRVRDGAAEARCIELAALHAITVTDSPDDLDARSWALDAGYVLSAECSYDPPTRPLDDNGQGDPYAIYGYAAQIAELEVDTGTGLVTLLRILAAHDVGHAINPMMVEGQIHGGVAQGIGMALMEEFVPGRTENLHDYLIPTIGDVPPIESIIVEVADSHGPFGAKGLGEHVLIPTAPAILNAIHHACGARITRLPATPDKVLDALSVSTRS